MTTKALYLWVEGPDDQRFIERIMCPLFERVYEGTHVVPYATQPKKKVDAFLSSIDAMKADYIFFGDCDSSCVSATKQHLVRVYCRLDRERIVVVVKEIESWYLAGLDDEAAELLGVPCLSTTDTVTKESFNKRIPSRFDSRIDFMQEIINHFKIETALAKNESLRYLVSRYYGDVPSAGV